MIMDQCARYIAGCSALGKSRVKTGKRLLPQLLRLRMLTLAACFGNLWYGDHRSVAQGTKPGKAAVKLAWEAAGS